MPFRMTISLVKHPVAETKEPEEAAQAGVPILDATVYALEDLQRLVDVLVKPTGWSPSRYGGSRPAAEAGAGGEFPAHGPRTT